MAPELKISIVADPLETLPYDDLGKKRRAAGSCWILGKKKFSKALHRNPS